MPGVSFTSLRNMTRRSGYAVDVQLEGLEASFVRREARQKRRNKDLASSSNGGNPKGSSQSAIKELGPENHNRYVSFRPKFRNGAITEPSGVSLVFRLRSSENLGALQTVG